jgi:MTH538 TIR-like domain (DUF1863)
MDKTRNIFISHHGKDDDHVQDLKKRLRNQGYNIRNSSIDSTKHREVKPSDAVIARLLRKGISWAGTFICLIGPETHTRPWVNYEIRQAHLQGKRMVGVYLFGSNNNVELPDTFKKYGGPTLGWNSLDKLGDAMDGKSISSENPDGTKREPIFPITRIKCK